MKTPIAVTGVWLMTGHEGRLQVLVETDGKWKLLKPAHGEKFRDGTISEIWEPAGIESAPWFEFDKV